jgi:LuxR family maltose regulon positive regulatory protein
MALEGEGFSFREDPLCLELAPGRNLSHADGLLYNSGLRFLLYEARARQDPTGLASGIEVADRLIANARHAPYLLVMLEALLLRAQMQAASHQDEFGLADVVRALELASPEGLIGVFLEQGQPVARMLATLLQGGKLEARQRTHVEQILAAFAGRPAPGTMADGEGRPVPSAPREPALVEPLTDRELEVLGLMAKGLKYKEIAARLYISLNTVRFHVKAIYGKLDVNNRTQALAAARQLRIL